MNSGPGTTLEQHGRNESGINQQFHYWNF